MNPDEHGWVGNHQVKKQSYILARRLKLKSEIVTCKCRFYVRGQLRQGLVYGKTTQVIVRKKLLLHSEWESVIEG